MEFLSLNRACCTNRACERPYLGLIWLFLFFVNASSVKWCVVRFLSRAEWEISTLVSVMWRSVGVIVPFLSWWRRRIESFLRRQSLVGIHELDVLSVLILLLCHNLWFTYTASRLILCAHFTAIGQVLADVYIPVYVLYLLLKSLNFHMLVEGRDLILNIESFKSRVTEASHDLTIIVLLCRWTCDGIDFDT